MTPIFYKLSGKAKRLSIAIGLALALLTWISWKTLIRPAPPPTHGSTASVPAGLRLTAAQWGSLTIEPARAAVFDSVVSSDGFVAANDNTTSSVFSQFSGRVVAIYAQQGQTVRKGDPLLAVLATEAAQTKSDLAAAAATEGTARKQLQQAQLTERRQHELLLAEAGAEKDWLQSKTDLAAAENAHHAAEAALAAAREKAAVLTDATGGGMGRVGQAVITAPISGIVLQRQIAPGQFISSLATGGSTPLYTITDLRTVWVVASVSEIDAARAKIGQPVEITVLALPGLKLRTHLTWVAATVDPATHRVALRAELPNPDQALKPHMSVSVRLLESSPTEAIAVPRSAVVYQGQQAHCYVETAQHTLVGRKLEIGRIQDGLAEVKAGLAAGERVVTRGTLFIDRAAEGESS